MTKSEKKRELLARPGMLLLPGVGDALSARVIEEAGFEAVSVSGQCVASRHGMPDVGLLTMTEIVQNAAVIAEAVDIPVRADADTGYGNAINVIRTVREFERAGVALFWICFHYKHLAACTFCRSFWYRLWGQPCSESISGEGGVW